MSDEDRETGGGLLSEDPPVEEEGAGARPDPILLMWPSRTKMLLNPVLWTSMALVFGISSCFVGGFVAIISKSLFGILLGVALFAVEWILARGVKPAVEALPSWHALQSFAGGKRLVSILVLDALLISASLYIAYLLRFEGQIWPEYRRIFTRFLPLFLVIRLSLHLAFGLHRWSFRLSSLADGARIAAAGLSGSGLFIGLLYLLDVRHTPRSVVVMEAWPRSV